MTAALVVLIVVLLASLGYLLIRGAREREAPAPVVVPPAPVVRPVSPTPVVPITDGEAVIRFMDHYGVRLGELRIPKRSRRVQMTYAYGKPKVRGVFLAERLASDGAWIYRQVGVD